MGRDGSSPQSRDLHGGQAHQPVPLPPQLTGHGEAVLPAALGGGVGVVGVGHAHPAEHQAAVPVLEGLGGIEVKAQVHLHKLAQGILPPEVPVEREIAAGVHVLEPGLLVGHPLGRAHQEPLPVHTEQVGALPHVAEVVGGLQGLEEGPVELVRGLKHQQLAVVVQGAGPLDHVVFPVLSPHLGVPDVAGQAVGIVFILHQQGVGLHRHPVFGHRQGGVVAPPGLDVVVISGVLHVSGVVEIQRSVLHQGGAGVHPVDVPGLVRVEHDGQGLPVEQVPAAIVAPVLHPSGDVKGPVLIKHVVPVPASAQAVGVIEPPHRGHQVKGLAEGVCGRLGSVFPFHPGHQPLQIPLQCITHGIVVLLIQRLSLSVSKNPGAPGNLPRGAWKREGSDCVFSLARRQLGGGRSLLHSLFRLGVRFLFLDTEHPG